MVFSILFRGLKAASQRAFCRDRRRGFKFRPQFEAFEDRLCPSSTTVSPLSAFLSQQGTTMAFTPPVPDQVGWTDSIYNPGTTNNPNLFLLADYTGQAAHYVLENGIDLHTKVTGFVTETPIGASGLEEVSVNLEATNALTWVADLTTSSNVNTAPLELGYRAQDLVANPSLKPALSTVSFQITFQQDVGAPLPDLVQPLGFGNNPNGFSLETLDFQSYGTGVLRPATTVGTPGQSALVYTSQVADISHPSLPGTLPDGSFQEPVDIVPVASSSTHVAYLNDSLFVIDQSNSNDNVVVTPAAHGGATVLSNLGNATYAPVTSVVVGLGGGNDNVVIGDLPATTVNVNTLDGNDNIVIGNTAKLVVHVGEGNNNIITGNSSPAAQFICVGGSGNNNITTFNATPAVIIVAGNGNNNILAGGTGDFIELLGNGNNNIVDTGSGDLVWLGGDGNNNIDNDGSGSFTQVLAGTGHNHIRGPH
jgi:hypothetical protein